MREVQTVLRRLERERVAWAGAIAHLHGAAVASIRQDLERSRTLLQSAIEEFTALNMPAYAAAARQRSAQMVKGDERSNILLPVDSWMKSQEIRNPDRLVALYAPGFTDQ